MRNIIVEIDERKARHPSGSNRFDLFYERFRRIIEGHDGLIESSMDDGAKKELLRYIPIAMVACMENYFRMAIADLINIGSPFADQVSEFKEIKVPLFVASALHTNKLTLGDFIAHLLPLNNLSDINRNVSTIIGCDFLRHLRESEFDLGPEINKGLIERDDDLFSGLAKVFELRHIYCHEIAAQNYPEAFDVVWGIFTVDAFVGYSEMVFSCIEQDPKSLNT